jgi:GT2 family glycosyltransferase
MERSYSFVVPVYNRPGELSELLASLAGQTLKRFEVVIVEDGSDLRSDQLVTRYSGQMEIQYIDLMRSGPSRARNVGSLAANGDYLIYVDSDCILPEDYLEKVDRFLDDHPYAFFGGPDRAAGTFNRTQKAISYAMTSFLTTGGIRGGRRQVDRFYPRSFNMGISREAFATVGGYPETRMHPGEDMVLSIELIRSGFKAGLIREAYVYHKRRTSLRKFFKQVYGFGKTRYIISQAYPETFRIFYLLPSLFLAGCFALVVLAVLFSAWFLLPLGLWLLMVLTDSVFRTRSLSTGLVSVAASAIQMSAYGTGFLGAWLTLGVWGKDEYEVLTKGFYPGRRENGQAG